MKRSVAFIILLFVSLMAHGQTVGTMGLPAPQLNGLGLPATVGYTCNANLINMLYVNYDPSISGGRLWLCLYNSSTTTFSWQNLPTTTFYNSSGQIASVKCFVGNVASTTATGAWTLNYSAMGLTSLLSVQPQSLSSGATALTTNMATVTSTSTTAASGYVMTGTTVAALGGLTLIPQATSTTVYLMVCGT